MKVDPMHTTGFAPVMADPRERMRTAETTSAGYDGAGAIPSVPVEQEPRKPGTLRLLVAHNKTYLAPWGWMAAADVTAFTSHYVAPAVGWSPILTAAAASATVAAGNLWHTRDKHLQKKIKTARTRRKVHKSVRIALTAGTLWELLAAAWTPIGPHAGMQLTLLGGGLTIAAPHLWRNRRRPGPSEPIAAIAAPVEDPRISKFRVQFCATGPLKEARIHDHDNIPGGFRFALELSLAYRGKFRDVKNLEDDIAALYDVPNDHVSVEPPENRSARRAVVTVLTETKAHERDEKWDGESTYNPATGTIILGRFADSTPSHWQLHIPNSGAVGGIAVGVQGSGKTGTMNVVACEAGQAKLCASCLAEHSCVHCDMRRICAVWIGDPQRQPMGVWRGRADVTAWGPLSCVRLLSWTHAAMRERADHFGRMEWTDHLGRANVGKGWFDPTPQFPQILTIIDEWPIIEGDPALAAFAIPLLEEIGREGRKVGVAAKIGSQNSQVDELGGAGIRDALTAYNVACHRCDRIAKQMLGLDGNPADLPEGVHGVSYLKGYDRRSGIVQRTKHLPEYLRPGQTGVDVRALADRIAADPITYDPAVMAAITGLGYTGPGQVLDDEDGWDINTLLGAIDEDTEPEPVRAPAPRTLSEPASGPDVGLVRDALDQRRNADVFDLMAMTGLSAFDVSCALDALISDGAALPGPSGRYASCT